MKPICAIASIILMLTAVLRASPILGQVDDFQDGTTQGWISGLPNPNPPVNVSNAGPLGFGDNALEVTSTGGIGPGSRLAAFNITQWTGDYLAVGATGVQMDLNNIGSVDLTLRLVLRGAGGDFSTTIPAILPAGGGWQTTTFGVTPGDLVTVGGLDLNATLAAVNHLRIMHSTVASTNGTPVVATLRVDNITMLPIPVVLLAGDANRDGQVSAGDYASVQANFGNTGAPNDPALFGDANLDGLVSAGDYASVQANFGNTASAHITPEPTTLALLGLGGVAMIGRRRK